MSDSARANNFPVSVLSKWGNSKALRIPAQILKKAKLEIDDKVFFDIDEKTNKIIISKLPVPKEGTLEYLFRDYSGEIFNTEPSDLGESVGEEKW